MRVLLVDDEKELVSALAERLNLRGIEADYAVSAQEAMEKAEDATFDLAVLDVKMPRIGGLELKKMLSEKQPGMRFVFLTGHGSEEDFVAGSAEAGGRKYYLAKPVRIEALIAAMQEALEEEGD